MMKLIQEKFITPEQKQLAVLVGQKGGKAVVDDEEAMEALMNAEAAIAPSIGRSARKFGVEDLLREIRCDPIEAIEKNRARFDDILKVQARKLEDCVERVAKQQGDRVISAVTAGQHDRIIDPVRVFVRPRIFA